MTYHMPADVDHRLLRRLLREAGLKRKDVAAEMGISESYLHAILDGKTKPARALHPSNRLRIEQFCAILTKATGVEHVPTDLARLRL